MNIRNATMADLDEITRVESECFPAAEAASREEFEQRLKYYPGHFWLLEDGDTLVSFVNGLVTNERDLTDEMYENAAMHDENGAWQMIFGVDVAPVYQHRGCASYLLRRVILDSTIAGRKGIVLTCKERLVGFYSRLGFMDEGMSASTHGNVAWHQMRLTLAHTTGEPNDSNASGDTDPNAITMEIPVVPLTD